MRSYGAGRKGLAAAGAFVLLVSIASCTQPSSSPNTGATPKQGGTLNLSAGGDPLALDPSLIKASQGTQVDIMVAETLTTYINTGKLEGLLATEWSSNDAGDAWTFTLRSGVKFHDGNPLNAEAVKKSIDRLLDPQLAVVTSNDVGKFVKSVDVLDDQHVRFNLNQAVRYFPSAMSNETSAITSPASWTANGNTYKDAEHVVGTGPYMLTEYVVNDHVTLTRNPNYWGKAPYYEKQVFKVIPDANARETALRAGQLDVASILPAPDIDSMKADPNLNVQIAFGTRTIYMNINTTSTSQPLLQSPLVRQALNYAVDKDAIVKNVLFGAGQVSTAAVIPTAFGYCKTGPYPYDPAKAKALLQQANATNLEITIATPNGRFLQDSQTAQAIAGYLKDVGIKVNGPLVGDNASNQAIVGAPPATSNPDSRAQVSIWSFAGDFADASQPIGRLYTSTSIPPQPGINYAHYSNSTVDQLNLTGATEKDESKANAAYCQALTQIWNDAPQIFLWTSGYVAVSSKKVAGVSVAPVNGIFNTIYAYPTD